jgi:outer membrane receptor for ferrienterochelin and colicins
MRLLVLAAILGFLGISGTVSVAQTSHITILDHATNTPLPGVHLRITQQGQPEKGLATDKNGQASFRITQPARINCSFLGYQVLTDSIHPGSSYTFRLREKTNGLQEVVITGQYQPKPVEKSLYKVKVLDQTQIVSRGAVNLKDLMAAELNVRIINDHILGSNILLQGISGQNVKVLLDGVPLISGEANEIDLSQLNLNNIERVEVIEGPLSVQYGTNALAGTVNLISKSLPEGKKYAAGLNTYYETVGQYNIDANIGTEFRGNKMYGSFGRNQFTGYSSLNVPRSMNWNPKEQYFGNFRWNRRFNRISTGLTHNHLWEESTSLGAPDPSTQYRSTRDNVFSTLRWNSSLFVNGRVFQNGYIDLVNSYSVYARTTDRYLVNLSDESRRRDDRVRTDFSSWVFRGAYSQQKVGAGNVGFQLGYDLNLNNSIGDRVSEAETGINDLGFYGSMHLQKGSLEVQPALRYTYNNRYDTRDINFLNMRLPVIPSLNLKYNLSEESSVRASYAKGFRIPSLRELYWYHDDANHFIIGNALYLEYQPGAVLQPELADNYILSGRFSRQIGNITYTLAPQAFYNQIINKIELVDFDRSVLPPNQQSKNVVRTYANIPDFRTMGTNAELTIAYGDRWQLRPGVGVLARSGSRSLNKKFYSWEASTNAFYHLPRWQTRLNLFYKYNGPMAQFALNKEGQLVDRTLQDYHMMDVSATKAFLQKRASLTMGIKNLFNVTDVAQTGEGTEGLVVRAGFKQTLPISWGTTLFVRTNFNF